MGGRPPRRGGLDQAVRLPIGSEFVADHGEGAVDRFLALIRVAGASFPIAASMVQLQAEIDIVEMRRRIEALEDPVAGIHPDVPAVGALIYHALGAGAGRKVYLEEAQYDRFGRCLAALEARGLVQGGHTLGRRYEDGLRVADPFFLVYLARAFDEGVGLASVLAEVDECAPRTWLNGERLAEEHKLPLSVVHAVFQVYEAMGYGLTSKTIGESRYRAVV